MELSHDDVKKILEIIDSAEHLQEVDLAYGGFHLRVHRGRAAESSPGQPALPIREPSHAPSAPISPAGDRVEPSPAPSAPLSPRFERVEPPLAENEIAIRAPMLGTFYRSPSPGEPAFVETGQRVRADDTVCLIEVMKLFSSIRAGVDGVVARILAENGSLVQYDQVLIVVSTAA